MVSQTLRVATNDIENQIDDLSLSTSNSDYDAAIIANECTPLVTPRIMTPSERRDSFRSIQSGIDAIYALPGMRIRSHCIGENGGLTPCTEEEALAGANQKQKNGNHKQQYYWMDIDADPTRDAEELRAWLRALHLPNFVIEALSEPPETWASQVMPLQRACLAVLRILPEHYDDQEQLMAHLAALSLRNMLITFSVNPRTVGNLYDPVRKRMQQAERLPSPTSQGAMISWLRFHLDRTSRATRELRYAVLTMDESMDRDIASVKLEELIAAKDRVLILLSVAEEQVECVESLLAATTAGTPTAASNTTSPSNASFVRNGEKLGNGLDFSPVQGSLASLVAAGKFNIVRKCLNKNKKTDDSNSFSWVNFDLKY